MRLLFSEENIKTFIAIQLKLKLINIKPVNEQNFSYLFNIYTSYIFCLFIFPNVQDGSHGKTMMQRESLLSKSIDHVSSVFTEMNGVRNQEDNLSVDKTATESIDNSVTQEMQEMTRIFKEKESKLLTELQDAKDQSELLEFRVLELEEEQEKVYIYIYIYIHLIIQKTINF